MHRTLHYLKQSIPYAVGFKLLVLVAFLLFGVGQFALANTSQDKEDTEAPSYVDGLKVTPGDSEATLSWNTATDNVGVIGYKAYFGTESVTEAGEEYNLGFLEVGNVLTYIVPGLENGTKYYFAITAVDKAENESTDYSFEGSATPEGAGDDGEHPTVLDAKATLCTTLEVTFSEAVTFPEENPGDAFTIENLDSMLYLAVTNVSHSDAGDEKLVLTTEDMSAGAQYILTVGTAIEDRFDHAMVSGTSDTAIFTGLECVAEEEVTVDEEETLPKEDTEVEADADVTAPSLEEVTVVSANEIELSFDEDVYLPEDEDLEDNVDQILAVFEIFDADDNVIEVTAVEYKISEDAETGDMVEDHSILVLATSDHSTDTEYFITVTGAKDEAGNKTTGDLSSAATYTTPAEFASDEVLDVIAPEDVTEFVSAVAEMIVNLSWKASVNSAGDLVDQILYVSTDGGATYEEVTPLGDATEYTYEGGVEGQTYMFKVVTRDETGNASDGMVTTAVLPTTGPGLALLGAASLFGGGLLSRRKNRK